MMKHIRLISLAIIFSMVISLLAPASAASAAGNERISLTVLKDNAPVRAENNKNGKVLQRLGFGTVIYAVKECKPNSAGNIWYKVEGYEEGYIYSGNVQNNGKVTVTADNHVCNEDASVVVGSVFYPINEKVHRRTDTVQKTCSTCGSVSGYSYTAYDENCSFSLDTHKCKLCANTATTLQIVTDATVNTVNNIGNAFAAEMKSEETPGKVINSLWKRNYADESDATLTGATAEVVASVIGVDAPLDFLDWVVDCSMVWDNLEEKGLLKTLGILCLDLVAFAPVIGAVAEGKKLKVIGDVAKQADNIGEAIDNSKVILKTGEVIAEAAAEIDKTAMGVVDGVTRTLKTADSVKATSSALKAADIVKDTSKTSETATDIAKAIDKTKNLEDTEILEELYKHIPGTKPAGVGTHNKTISALAESVSTKTGDQIVAGGGVLKEKLIPTPAGAKSGRRPDILLKRADGTMYGINVGKTYKNGDMIKREKEAIEDLTTYGGLEMYFVNYD